MKIPIRKKTNKTQGVLITFKTCNVDYRITKAEN